MDLSKKKVLSGITPSSSAGLHIGNFLGAVKLHVKMQHQLQRAMYMVADYHSLNTVFDPEEVRGNVFNVYLDYLSFGLEPDLKKIIFFVESAVPEIAELNIILNNVVTMAELKRMHAFKDKFAKSVSPDSINHGLFNYPVLMAADILIFHANIVPVGEDQRQHVEITREIAQSFNNRYGEVLTIPEVYINKETAKVVGTDGEKKMSKSIGNQISVFAPEEEVRKQIFSAKTDPNRIHATDPGDPEKNVLFSYMQLLDFNSTKLEDFRDRYKDGTVKDVEIKEAFYEHFLEYFKPHRERRAKYAANPNETREMMKANNKAAREIAEQTMEKVKSAAGLLN